ncbi:MAG TPA: SIS domain-containing protein [Acidimicrobiales bacterium]|nr:SIS domain-containing protein [Acidimicrobiales bacterium]
MSGTDFLYPFLEGDETDAGALLTDLAASASAKAAESEALRAATLDRLAGALGRSAQAMAGRFAAGGRLFTFGNGGSATDAGAAAALFSRPYAGRPLPARSLAEDAAVLSALGNDVGFELVFARQLIAQARAQDIAAGFSTSGNSANVLRAFADARARGLLTIGFAGYDGGAMAASGDIDHLLVVEAQSIHRIQEVQAALVHALWTAVGEAMAGEAAP